MRAGVTRLLRAGPPVVVALLLVPAIAAWLDVARSTIGERYAYRETDRRVVVLGFDGVDPGILSEYIERLPAMAALARDGTFLPCRTTDPPESPVAWATFATGLNPGQHGIFDFVRRDLKAADPYRPLNGMVKPVPPELGPLGFPIRPPQAINLRQGEGFWEPVARLGYRVSILRMPLTFPAHETRGGELLAGLGVPDLRATQGSYTLFAAGPDAWEGVTEFGGLHVKIYPRNGVAETHLDGPVDPRAPKKGKRLRVPVRITFAGASAAVQVGDAPAVAVDPDLYSAWVPVVFRVGPLVRLHGLVRFLLLRTGPDAALYASPIQIDPEGAVLPISAPDSFAASIVKRLGPMKTAGWPQDTFAANDGVLDDVQLFADIRDTYRSNERLLLDRMERSRAALVSMVFTATDRVSHMYFRYRDTRHPAYDRRTVEEFTRRTGVHDPIFESYRWMDRTVGEVLKRLGPRDLLLIVSDHGFHTWRMGLNLNTWLLREGYLALADPAAARRSRDLDTFFRRSAATAHVDWSNTRAYALGLGQIYLNLQGRESDGTVPPGERAALVREIIAKLRTLHGPDGSAVFSNVYPAGEIWHGPRVRDAPDIQCAFADGYRVSWQTALLGVPEKVFTPNTKRWSGDHCSNDSHDTAGVFLCNRKLAAGADPGLDSIAPTVCKLFGAAPPPGATAAPLPILPAQR